MYQLDPPSVYVNRVVLDRPERRRRFERVMQALGRAPTDAVAYADDQLPDLIESNDWRGIRRRMGTLGEVRDPVLLFNAFRFDGGRGDAVRRFDERSPGFHPLLKLALLGYGFADWFPAGLPEDPARHDKVCRPCWRLHFQQGCVHRCAYCGEGGLLVTMTNPEEYIDALRELIPAHPWQETYLFEDDADVLCLEPELDALGPIIEYFGTLPDRYLIIHTKSANVDWMLDLRHNGKTIVVWSLTSGTVSRRIEPRTATTEERIEAARKLQEAGYTVRYKCKPIIPVQGWQEEAADMIERLFAATSPDVISLFCFAWSTVDDMKACLDVGLLDPRFVRAAEESIEEVRDTMSKPFPEWARAEVYTHYLREIRKWSEDVPVSLSTETWAMWKRFEGALGATARNYVCGCGPQSVPGRRLLDVDPFSVAVRCRVNVGDDGEGWYGEQDAAD